MRDDPARVRRWLGRRQETLEGIRPTQDDQLERCRRKLRPSEGECGVASPGPLGFERLDDRVFRPGKQGRGRRAYAPWARRTVEPILARTRVGGVGDPRAPPAGTEPTNLAGRKVATQGAVQRFIETLALPYRARVLTLATSGVRIGALGRGDASEGPRCETRADIGGCSSRFENGPPMIAVPARTRKNDQPSAVPGRDPAEGHSGRDATGRAPRT